ncbi:MAG: branched-chain amino acid ABC transporter permease [Anaerolineae bacterium]|nr:MAG: branched-chain amino acid ABC transporter permease [Anaerolineae bacterium]
MSSRTIARIRSADLRVAVPLGGLLILAIFAPVLMIALGVPPYWFHVSIVAMYYAILAASWSLLAGYAGQFSFGTMAFMAIGAYTAGLLGQYMAVGVVPGIILGTLLAGVFGFIIGALTLRLRRTYLALFTIAFSEILRLVLMAEHRITEGPDGLSMVPLVNTTSKVPAYYIHLALLVFGLAFMYALVRSRFGLFFRSIREDEEAAAALGVHVVRYKIFVFVVTSMIAGLAGAVQFHYVEIITPNVILILQMSIVITMAVIGGIESLIAAAFGAILIQFGLEIMRPLLNWRLVVFGLLLMLTLRFFQNGLLHPVLQYVLRREEALAETVAKRKLPSESEPA